MTAWIMETLLVTTGLTFLVGLWTRSRSASPAVAHILWLLVLLRFVCPSVVTWPWAFTAAPQAAPTSETDRGPDVVTSSVAVIEFVERGGPEMSAGRVPVVLPRETLGFDPVLET